jgi:hypothetical protein
LQRSGGSGHEKIQGIPAAAGENGRIRRMKIFSWRHPRSTDQLEDQYKNPVQEGGYEYSLCGLVAVGIDIKSKYDGIGQQGDAADGRKQGFIGFQEKEIIPQPERAREIP